MKKLIFLLMLFCISASYAQYNKKDSNRIGISGGVTQLSLYSNQFNAKEQMGFVGGFSMRGNYYNNWQAIYGMNFTQSSFSLQSITNKEINYDLQAVQVYLLGSYMIVENHLNIEFGPVLQVNGKLKLDADNENVLLKDSPLVLAKELADINTITGNVYGGVTFGFTNFRLNVNYQYSFINNLNKLNKTDDLQLRNGNKDFKGNFGMLSAVATIYL